MPTTALKEHIEIYSQPQPLNCSRRLQLKRTTLLSRLLSHTHTVIHSTFLDVQEGIYPSITQSIHPSIHPLFFGLQNHSASDSGNTVALEPQKHTSPRGKVGIRLIRRIELEDQLIWTLITPFFPLWHTRAAGYYVEQPQIDQPKLTEERPG